MLHLTKLRDLTLLSASDPQRPAYISAASGLVQAGRYLYVVMDDELHLGQFVCGSTAPGELLRVFPGELPDKKKPRKKHKPDLEVLLQLPAFATCPFGALLALGSGSTERRYRAVLLPLAKDGAVLQAPQVLDAEALYEPLVKHFDELNLEGGYVHGNDLRLLQRGNKGDSPNAVIHLALPPVLASLAAAGALPAITPLAIHTMELGSINNVPLCFSDASVLPDGRWLFTSVAEDADNAYDDGVCAGAAIGMADASSQLLWIRQVAPSYKIEGIEAQQAADGIHLLLVTDADDVAVPSSLLSAVV